MSFINETASARVIAVFHFISLIEIKWLHQQLIHHIMNLDKVALATIGVTK